MLVFFRLCDIHRSSVICRIVRCCAVRILETGFSIYIEARKLSPTWSKLYDLTKITSAGEGWVGVVSTTQQTIPVISIRLHVTSAISTFTDQCPGTTLGLHTPHTLAKHSRDCLFCFPRYSEKYPGMTVSLLSSSRSRESRRASVSSGRVSVVSPFHLWDVISALI